PSELVRDQYVMQVADRCRVEPERLRDMVVRTARGELAPAAATPTTRARRVERPAEKDAAPVRRAEADSPARMVLRLAVHQPEAVADVLDEVLFGDEVDLAAYRALAEAATLHEAIEAAEPEAAELLQRLAVEEVDADLDPADVVALLVAEAARRAYVEVLAEVRADSSEEAVRAADWLRRRMEELKDP